MRYLVLVLLALFAVIGAVAAEDLLDRIEKNLTFTMDQRVSGAGFFSTYKYALMPDLDGTEGELFNGAEAKNKAHGSGTIDTESVFSGESTYVNTSHIFDVFEPEEIEIHNETKEIEIVDDYEITTTSVVALKEDSKMTYNPTTISVGTRYYAAHPLTYKTLLNEETWAKDRDYFNSLNHRVEGAHGLEIALDALSDLTDTTINVDENLVDGKAHFGALQLEGIPKDEEPEDETEEPPILGPAMKAWHKPLAEMDVDYVGTYHIRNNMTLSVPLDEETEYEDSWLPCCSGGYFYMTPGYQKGSKGFGSNVAAIFDCTCPKALTQAQFPRVY
ncbi:Uncharacterised protein [uncultured archaeon]|nr:Uncharacterised protein [uncultured archaeon]